MPISYRVYSLTLLLALAAAPAAFPQNTILTTSTAVAGGGNANVLIGPGNVYSGSLSGGLNTFVGRLAGVDNTTGSQNSFIGGFTGWKNTAGEYNTFTGYGAGYSNTGGDRNTFTGSQSGHQNTTGNYNSFTGFNAGYRNTTGSNNSFTGNSAGFYNTTGSNNSFTGHQAGYDNTTGSNNSFMGNIAGQSNTTGHYNSFVGTASGYSNTTGQGNSFMGYGAGYNNITGSNNSFTGNQAGNSNTSGLGNSFTGFEAGNSNTTGHYNTMVGYQAGYNNINGHNNSFFGRLTNATGSNDANLQRATALGYRALVAVSDGLVLGDTANVKVGIGTAYPNERFTLRGNINLLAFDNSMMLKGHPFLHFNERKSLALGLGAEIPDGAERTLVLGSDETTVQIPGLLSTYQPNVGQFLTVNQSGKVVLSQSRVQVAHVGEWSDKVFEPNYALRPLSEVAEFVKTNRHLPGVPSAAEMVAEGMESTAFNAKLLEKVEELTLYVVELEKKNEEVKVLRDEVAELKLLIQQIMPQTLSR